MAENEMIERAGRNLQKAWDHSSLPPITFSETELEALASAVINAMRDPTDAMLAAAQCHTNTWFAQDDSDRETLTVFHHAMIDAALSTDTAQG